MSNLLGVPQEQLRAMTRIQIRTALSDYFSTLTKRELIAWLIEGQEVSDSPVDTYGVDGQISKRVETFRDIETGEKIYEKITRWSYYPNGDVDVIRIAKMDASDNEVSRIRIKHFQDGRKPEMMRD